MADVNEQKSAVEEVAPAVAQPDQVDTPATEPEEDIKSKRVTLADLSAKGTRLHANKQYDEAADVFGTAAEMQAELNGGDIHPDNGEILFFYGRSLFKVGQSKSDVLGGKAPETKAEKAQPKKNAPRADAGEASTEAEKVTQEGLAVVAEQTSGAHKQETTDNKKPMFQFEGDENFDESDDEEVEADHSPDITSTLLMFRRVKVKPTKRKRKKMTYRLPTTFWSLPVCHSKSVWNN